MFKWHYFDQVYSRFTRDGKMAFFTSQTRPLRRETSQRRQLEVFLPVFSLPHAVTDVCRRQILSRLIPAAPSPPPPTPLGLLRGICPPCQSRGWGIWQPRGQPRAFDTHAVSYQNKLHRGFYWKNKQIGSFVKDGNWKIEEICKGMFSILSMHFFIAYQARST